MMSKKSLILLIFLLGACSHKIGNKNTLKIITNPSEIIMNQQDIIKKYGSAQNIWTKEENREIWQYLYGKNSYDLASLIPIINHFGWVNGQNYEVLLLFDQNGALEEIKKFSSQAKWRNGLICNPEIYECLYFINNTKIHL